jgi:hypothetical protein
MPEVACALSGKQSNTRRPALPPMLVGLHPLCNTRPDVEMLGACIYQLSLPARLDVRGCMPLGMRKRERERERHGLLHFASLDFSECPGDS